MNLAMSKTKPPSVVLADDHAIVYHRDIVRLQIGYTTMGFVSSKEREPDFRSVSVVSDVGRTAGGLKGKHAEGKSSDQQSAMRKPMGQVRPHTCFIGLAHLWD